MNSILMGMALLMIATSAMADNTESKAAYPLTTCVVSGEPLGEMGEPYDYTHKEEGKPDRLVRFCCKKCVKDFRKDPETYLHKIDAATAAKAGVTGVESVLGGSEH